MDSIEEAIEVFVSETQAIWLSSPDEIVALGAGEAKRPAGSRSRYLTLALFAESSARLFADEVLWQALTLGQRSDLDVTTLADVASAASRRKAEFFQFIDLRDVSGMAACYAAVVLQCGNVDRFRRLTEAVLAYFNRVHVWLDLIGPWSICDGFPLKTGLRPARKRM